MINIRKNVFETNSSSTHSICISRAPAKWGTSIVFSIGEYGWENDTVSDTASYLYTGIFEMNNWKEYLDRLAEILTDHNVEYVFLPPRDGGYIDHGCELRDLIEDLLNDEDKLCRFLFGDSVIYTGNDNDGGDEPKLCDASDEYYYTHDNNWNYTKNSNPYHDEKKYEYYYKGN